jgi:four helix bundle protein
MTKSQLPNKYDLEERTAKFAEKVIELCRKVPKNAVTTPLINQLVKAASSVAANYCEADDAESKKDFKHKIAIVKKESRESKLHLRLLGVAVPKFKTGNRPPPPRSQRTQPHLQRNLPES